VVNNLLELVGYALVVAFLWFVWPPLCLLGAGLLLVVWANARAGAPSAKKARRWGRRRRAPLAEVHRVA
jgi:hypothetical protein